LQPAPHPPYKSPGLIRPIGTSAQQKPATPADAVLPDIHTPAHLLALSSNPPTPSATPSDPKTPNIQAPTSNAHSPHQFMRTVFIAPKEGTLKATPFPEQQNMAPPGPNLSIGPEQVQIQSLQLSQSSQSSQPQQVRHSSPILQHSNSLP